MFSHGDSLSKNDLKSVGLNELYMKLWKEAMRLTSSEVNSVDPVS